MTLKREQKNLIIGKLTAKTPKKKKSPKPIVFKNTFLHFIITINFKNKK